jgi:D-inositol-3-phosphate glycosyltransferase
MEEHLNIILYEPTGRGGICHYTYQLAEALAELGIAVTLFTTENYELKHFKSHFHIYYHIKRSSLKSFFTFSKAFLLRANAKEGKTRTDLSKFYRKDCNLSIGMRVFQVLRRWYRRLKALCFFLYRRPHIIHFQWLISPREDYYFIKALRLLRFKIIYTAHNLQPHEDNSEAGKKILRKIYESVDHIIVHANQNQTELIEQFKITINKTTVIPHGSYDLFSVGKNITRESARDELILPKDKLIVLFFGSIRKYKGLDYLIEAFQQVRRQIYDIVLLVVGKTGNGHNDSRYYSDLIGDLYRYEDIIFISKYIDVEKVGSYFSAADLVVLPYTETYQSGVLMLAYAFGKAVVVTNIGGLNELVVADKTGLVVPPCNSSALAEAITKILVNPDERESMGRRAKSLAETTYSWRNIALRTRKLYQSIAETN